MALTRVICTECKAVLKPATPVPEGKKIKCPKCQAQFVAEAEPDAVRAGQSAAARTKPDAAPERKPLPDFMRKGGKTKADAKKAAPEGKKPPEKKSTVSKEDEESAGTYGLLGGDAKKEGEEEEEGPGIDYAPDMSIKDLRGPAQLAINTPSNGLIMGGGFNCILASLMTAVIVWPFVFSDHVIDPKDVPELNTAKSDGKKEPNKKTYDELTADQKRIFDEKESELFMGMWLDVGLYVAVFVWNSVVALGGVKMQTMESYRWAMTAAIMGVLPMFCLPMITALPPILDDEPNVIVAYVRVVACVFGLWLPLFAVMAIKTLRSEKVLDGFEYVAE